MYIYAQSNEADELGVVNLTHVRVDHQKDLENMLNVRSFSLPLLFSVVAVK